jgi:hypothetical protein
MLKTWASVEQPAADAAQRGRERQEGREQLGLVARVAGQHRHLQVLAGADRGDRVGRQHVAVGNRVGAGRPSGASGEHGHAQQRVRRLAAQVGRDLGRARCDPGLRRRVVGGGAVGQDQQQRDERVALQRVLRRRDATGWRPAVVAAVEMPPLRADQPMEQRRRGLRHHRRRHQRQHVHRAGGLAHQRHVAGIAAEGADVALHELQRLDHVQHGEVAGVVDRVARLQLRDVQEAEDAQAVVHADDHGVGRVGEAAPS